MTWTVMSWNVLADAYVRASYYPNTPRSLLAAGARMLSIVNQVLAHDADLICLQEVEPALVDALQRAAALKGYSLRFARKQAGRPDGCALLARNSRVQILDVRTLVFADGAPDRENSGHIALIAEVMIEGRRVGVATTHLRWDKPGTPTGDRWAVRQARELLAAMLAGEWIVCGDFNFSDDDEVYARFLASGFVDAFATAARPTALTNGRAHRIDYLLHTGGLVASPRPSQAIDPTLPLPSATMPSDHLPISAHLSFR